MRKIYVLDHAAPASAEELEAAEQAGAAEIAFGLSDGLRADGVTGPGYHEIPAPPEPRRLVPKPVVLDRCRAISGAKYAAVLAIMYDETSRDALTRWNMPGHPNVYHDDAETLAVLELAGYTEEERAAIMAPATPL